MYGLDMKETLFCCIYRTGGNERFHWHRMVPGNQVKAAADAAEVERMGYKAMVVNYAQSLAIGLPETFDCPAPKRKIGRWD